MKTRLWILGLSFAGLLFSGYLSATKLLTETCAFNEPCPYFLGYPACWYGFAMYAVMFVAAFYAVVKQPAGDRPELVVTAVAAAGTVFSGSFAVAEIVSWFGPEGFVAYSLGLSTCMYGLIFFVLLLIIGWRSLQRHSTGVSNAPDTVEGPQGRT